MLTAAHRYLPEDPTGSGKLRIITSNGLVFEYIYADYKHVLHIFSSRLSPSHIRLCFFTLPTGHCVAWKLRVQPMPCVLQRHSSLIDGKVMSA
jgi:hypothetical protein